MQISLTKPQAKAILQALMEVTERRSVAREFYGPHKYLAGLRAKDKLLIALGAGIEKEPPSIPLPFMEE